MFAETVAGGFSIVLSIFFEKVSQDVKTIYFSEPVTGLPKPVFHWLPKGLFVSGIVTRSALAVSRSLVASRPAFQTHGRRETKDSGVSKR